MSEQKPEYIVDALEMIGTGYEPAAIIEQPTKRLVLREGLGEEWTVAWVKLSTAFKPHIKEIRGAPLAVWLYIALSVNKQGVSFPSINKIAEDTGYSRNGVMDAIKELEEKGYMKVRRGERKFNLYEPEFAAIGKMNEPSNESTQFTSPVLPTDESTFLPDESSVLDLNKRNKREQEPLTEKEKEEVNFEVDSIISGSIDPVRIREKQACDAFESAFGITRPWDWYPDTPADKKRTWKEFRAYLVELYQSAPDCFTKYVTWTRVPYAKGTMSALGIKRNPQDFPDSWACYLASESMYGNQEKTRLL